MANNQNRSSREDITRVIRNIFFKTALSTAKGMAGRPGRALSIVALAASRLAQNGGRLGFSNFRESLWLLINMLRAVIRGQYSLPTASLVKALTGVIYFVFLVDAIPDFIPVTGLLDDFAVVGWVMKSIEKDIRKFREWSYKEEEPVGLESAVSES